MPSKNFLSLINNKVKAWLNFEFENLKDQKNIIYDAAEESFGKEGIPLFEELLLNEKFKHYLRTRKRISPQRLEAQLLRLFNRATMEIPLSTIALIAYNMASDEYIESEKYFFKRKDSHSSLLLYESNFCKILEQNQNLINLFFEMVKSDHLHFLTEKYENQIQVYLFDKLTDLLMGVKSVELIEDCVRKLLSPVMSRFIQTSIDEDCWKSFLGDFIKLYYISKSMASNYILGAEIINGRYKYKKKTDMLEAIVLARLVELKEILVLLENDSKLRDFQKFIDKYGELFDDFQQFVWTTVLSCPEEKILPVMEILSSEPFSRLESFYTKDLSVLKFLIKSIITSMLDIKMKSFTPTSYKVILKLFLKLDVDVGLLRRRAFIFHILKRYTNSILIELEIIRYLFFEYIFIALKVVPDRGRVINRFCDEGHRTFCLWADETYREGLNLHPRERVEFYKPLFDYLRAIVWKDHFNKFEKYNYQLIRIQSTAISLETEDYVFNELEKVDSEDFPFYHDCFFDVFYSRPEDIGLAIQSDYWYRLPLAMARPHIQSLILTIVGTVTIKEGSLGAYTNGSFIALPKYVNYFKDRIEPLEKNRNLTIYMALAIHEAGHILAGTFRFNFQYYLKTLENPELFKTILNMFEDYRIESFIIKMKVHSQVEELINSMNHYFSLKNWREGQDTVFAFLTACVDFAFGYDSILNSWGGYELEIQKLYECNYNSGRFKNIKVFIEYIVDRLKNMKLGNPISAYMISREVYEILKLWPPECFDYQKGISTGNHECEFFESENNSSHSVLSDEELKNLYNSYNSDPYAFV
ncbi:MAG: hypothetical protein KDK36_18370, partial [Leptospiraceae bacterium]|nr:hypothetical protein [Leptospiraceae bacterium]